MMIRSHLMSLQYESDMYNITTAGIIHNNITLESETQSDNLSRIFLFNLITIQYIIMSTPTLCSVIVCTSSIMQSLIVQVSVIQETNVLRRRDLLSLSVVDRSCWIRVKKIIEDNYIFRYSIAYLNTFIYNY